MRNPSGHQGENERVTKSEQQQVRHFLYKACNLEVSGSFTLWSCKTTAKKCAKKCAGRAKLFFLLIRPIVVFSSFSLPSPVKVMLHGTGNDDFHSNTSCNVATMW